MCARTYACTSIHAPRMHVKIAGIRACIAHWILLHAMHTCAHTYNTTHLHTLLPFLPLSFSRSLGPWFPPAVLRGVQGRRISNLVTPKSLLRLASIACALGCANQAEKRRKVKRLKRESSREAPPPAHDEVLPGQHTSRVLTGVAVEVESTKKNHERRSKHHKAARSKPLPVPLPFN